MIRREEDHGKHCMAGEALPFEQQNRLDRCGCVTIGNGERACEGRRAGRGERAGRACGRRAGGPGGRRAGRGGCGVGRAGGGRRAGGAQRAGRAGRVRCQRTAGGAQRTRRRRGGEGRAMRQAAQDGHRPRKVALKRRWTAARSQLAGMIPQQQADTHDTGHELGGTPGGKSIHPGFAQINLASPQTDQMRRLAVETPFETAMRFPADACGPVNHATRDRLTKMLVYRREFKVRA